MTTNIAPNIETRQNIGVDIYKIYKPKRLCIAYRLLAFLLGLQSKKNRFLVRKEDISDRIDTSEQTVGKYLQELVNANILKYKYRGEIFFNPSVIYLEEPERLEEVQKQYDFFPSDMKPQGI